MRKKIDSGKKLWKSVWGNWMCWGVREESISLPTLRLLGGTATLFVTHSQKSDIRRILI